MYIVTYQGAGWAYEPRVFGPFKTESDANAWIARRKKHWQGVFNVTVLEAD